jgi:hypothetical protein
MLFCSEDPALPASLATAKQRPIGKGRRASPAAEMLRSVIQLSLSTIRVEVLQPRQSVDLPSSHLALPTAHTTASQEATQCLPSNIALLGLKFRHC